MKKANASLMKVNVIMIAVSVIWFIYMMQYCFGEWYHFILPVFGLICGVVGNAISLILISKNNPDLPQFAKIQIINGIILIIGVILSVIAANAFESIFGFCIFFILTLALMILRIMSKANDPRERIILFLWNPTFYCVLFFLCYAATNIFFYLD